MTSALAHSIRNLCGEPSQLPGSSVSVGGDAVVSACEQRATVLRTENRPARLVEVQCKAAVLCGAGGEGGDELEALARGQETVGGEQCAVDGRLAAGERVVPPSCPG